MDCFDGGLFTSVLIVIPGFLGAVACNGVCVSCDFQFVLTCGLPVIGVCSAVCWCVCFLLVVVRCLG